MIRYKQLTITQILEKLIKGPFQAYVSFGNDKDWSEEPFKIIGFTYASGCKVIADYGYFDRCAIKEDSPIDDEKRSALKVLYPKAKYLTMDESGRAFLFERKPDLQGYSSQGLFWAYSPSSITDAWVQPIETLDNYCNDARNSLVEL